MDVRDYTIASSHQAFREKKLTPTELVDATLARIDETEPDLNAFITTMHDQARADAAACDKLLASDPSILERKPLFGIPVALKDIYLTKGVRTTAASELLTDFIPPYDATVVQRYRDAGAIIVGKANLDAWAHGSSGENSQHGVTKNPYDLSKVPGGSSSGSAATVAAGSSMVSGGSDTGGSVRLPASFCNLVGLKPTYGRVSRYGIIAMASSLDCIGHFSRTVEDNARVLAVTAGPDQFDATTWPENPPNYLTELQTAKKEKRPFTIGVPKEFFTADVDPQIIARIQEVQKALEGRGIRFVEISLPHTSNGPSCYYVLCPAEVSSNLARYDGVRYGKKRNSFGPEAKRRIMLGTYVLSSSHSDEYYKKALEVRSLIKNEYRQTFETVDAIMAPTSPTLPFSFGERTNDPIQMYLSDLMTIATNIAGIPALSVPAGFIDDLPVGVQFMANMFDESMLFQIAAILEQEMPSYQQAPTYRQSTSVTP